jgi:hypothetical protein
MGSLDFTTINQHQLVEAVVRASGGEPVGGLLPPAYKGKKADIVFNGENVIADIKSLTFPDQLGDAIGEAWVAVIGQAPRPSKYETFDSNGMVE